MSDKLQFVVACESRAQRGQRQTEVCRTSSAAFSLFQSAAKCDVNGSMPELKQIASESKKTRSMRARDCSRRDAALGRDADRFSGHDENRYGTGSGSDLAPRKSHIIT